MPTASEGYEQGRLDLATLVSTWGSNRAGSMRAKYQVTPDWCDLSGGRFCFRSVETPGKQRPGLIDPGNDSPAWDELTKEDSGVSSLRKTPSPLDLRRLPLKQPTHRVPALDTFPATKTLPTLSISGVAWKEICSMARREWSTVTRRGNSDGACHANSRKRAVTPRVQRRREPSSIRLGECARMAHFSWVWLSGKNPRSLAEARRGPLRVER